MDIKVLGFVYELFELPILLYVWNLALSCYMFGSHPILVLLCPNCLGYKGGLWSSVDLR